MSQSTLTAEDVLAACAPDGVSTWLARSAAAAVDALPTHTEHVRQVLLDWCGVVLAGRSRLPALAPADLAFAHRAPHDVAFADAAAAHVLDFDDVLNDLPGHASATVVAAALATAHAEGASLSRLWAGVLGGVEVAARLGLLCGASQYDRGWHPTATLGSVASAAASGIVRGFDEQALSAAISLASLQSSGALVAFGSVGKSWQTGCAARDGVHAAQAVAAGYDTEVDYLGVPGGVLDLMSDWRSAPASPALDDARPRIEQTIYKEFVTCFVTHAAARCAEELGGRPEVAEGHVVGVQVALGPQFARIVANRSPRTSLETKFSVSAVVAMSLLGRAPRAVEDLDDDRLLDPAWRRVEELVELEVDAGLERAAARVTVQVEGSPKLLVCERDEPAPLPPKQAWPVLRAKFRALARPAIRADCVEALADMVEHGSGDQEVSGLVELLTPVDDSAGPAGRPEQSGEV